MPRESELLDPLVDWIIGKFGGQGKLLIHEEPQGRGGRRPDILVVLSERGQDAVDQVTLVSIEIECSSKASIHDRRNGLQQLRKYAGHAKYLAIPRTVAVRSEAREIPNRCKSWGVGLLVVDLPSGKVTCGVEPNWSSPARGLRGYPAAMDRWIALRESKDRYRRISRRRIADRA